MISYYYMPGMFWFRVFGVGLHFKDASRHRLIFSERINNSKPVYKNWHVKILKRVR